MIELFKIIKGIYDLNCVTHFDFVDVSEDTIRTRGHKYKLVQNHCFYDLRKYNFTKKLVARRYHYDVRKYSFCIRIIMCGTVFQMRYPFHQ